LIRQGLIVAVQGLGGFHLIVAATHEAAVSLLRQRKHRWEKPLAVMAQNVEQAREHIDLGPTEEAILTSPEGPIVLARKRKPSSIASNVAPDTPYLGVMLATTPLHHLLLNHVSAPIVATSGNLSEEPHRALQCRGKGIVERFPFERWSSILRQVASYLLYLLLAPASRSCTLSRRLALLLRYEGRDPNRHRLLLKARAQLGILAC
jgi:hypothetical protein